MSKSQSNRTSRSASGGARRVSARSVSIAQPQPGSARTRSSRTPTKADLENRVIELEAALKLAQSQAEAALKPQAELATALEAAQQQENSLKQQIANLQADFEKQQGRLFELKDALEQAKTEVQAKTDQLSQVTAELEEAKRVILKMTEVKPQPVSTPTSMQKIPERRMPEQKISERRMPDRRYLEMRPKSPRPKPIPNYAIQRAPHPGMLTNDEIGWVD